ADQLQFINDFVCILIVDDNVGTVTVRLYMHIHAFRGPVHPFSQSTDEQFSVSAFYSHFAVADQYVIVFHIKTSPISSYTSFNPYISISTSFSSVSFDMEIRILPLMTSTLCPIAVNVSFNVASFDAHALVVDTIIPFSDSAFTTTSPFAPTYDKFNICGTSPGCMTIDL